MKKGKETVMKLLALLLPALCLAACGGGNGGLPSSLPVYDVSHSGISSTEANLLASSLGISGDPLDSDGVFQHLDTARFARVPHGPIETGNADEQGQSTESGGLDIDALDQLPPVLSYANALSAAQSALSGAGLDLDGGTPLEGHTRFEAFDTTGTPLADRDLDTQVNYSFSIEGYPLVGPGAKAKFVFDVSGGERETTQARLALRSCTRGQVVPLAAREKADQRARAILAGVTAKKLSLGSPDLVYFAPPLSLHTVKKIYPHYRYRGTYNAGDRSVPMREILVPAIEAAPQVSISYTVSYTQVIGITAQAVVSGGTAPFTYRWDSQRNDFAADDTPNEGSSVAYDLHTFDRLQQTVGTDRLHVVVSDADGLIAAADVVITVNLQGQPQGHPLASKALPLSLSVVDVGTEWLGITGGLGGSAGNAGGFVTTFSDHGTPAAFNWGDLDAWEEDFKRVDMGGTDIDWVDNVDFVFYTGHAGWDGFCFSSAADDGFLHYSEAEWGNRDLEWLVIAACGPLQTETSPYLWYQRWGPAFKGLHLLMAYASGSYDNDVEGRLVAQRALAGWRLVDAWIQTAGEVQGSDVTWAIMGPLSSGSADNYNDHFWGHGATGPDITAPVGYWRLRGPC